MKNLRITILVFIATMALGMIFPSCHANPSGSTETCDSTEEAATEVTLFFAGDLMQHIPQINAAYRGHDVYDYEECFHYIKDEISSADIAIANFEVPLGGKPYTGYPKFSAPDAYLQYSVDAGFDILLTANNHCNDRAITGYRHTLEMMDSLHVGHIGTYLSPEQRSKQYPYIVEKNGIRIALLNYTYGTNGLPTPRGCVTNMLDTLQMKTDIKQAKALRPDVIIALPHWGIEYTLIPPKEEIEMAKWLFAQGVDHIVGGHPHVVQPIEVRTDANGRKHLLAYSLGNFLSNQNQPNCRGGLTLRMTLRKDHEGTTLAASDYSLIWVSRRSDSGNKNYRVYPTTCPDTLLNHTERSVRDTFLSHARKLFRERNIGIQEREIPFRQ